MHRLGELCTGLPQDVPTTNTLKSEVIHSPYYYDGFKY